MTATQERQPIETGRGPLVGAMQHCDVCERYRYDVLPATLPGGIECKLCHACAASVESVHNLVVRS